MKLLLLAMLITAILSLSTIYLFAQEDERPQRPKKTSWLPDNGYWVIESKLNQPDKSIVHFYNDENTEVYKEEINGVVLNVQKRKYRKQLKRILDKAMNAWARKEPLPENEKLLIAGLRK